MQIIRHKDINDIWINDQQIDKKKILKLLIHPSPLNNLVSPEYFQQLLLELCGSQDKVW